MAEQLGSSHFQALLESALQAYERKTGITLDQHPIAVNLQSCDTLDDITNLLEGRARAFNDVRERDRMIKAIKAIVSILAPLFEAASLAEAVGRTFFPPAKAIHVGLGILLDVANGVISNYDVLADLLESIEHFVDRLKIYTETSSTVAIDEILVNLIVELISILGLVTRKLNQRRSLKWVKNYFAVKDIKASRVKLERLLQEESRNTTAQIPVLHVDEIGKKSINDGKPPRDGVRKVPDKMTRGVDKSKRNKLRDDIRRWLSPPDPWKNYGIARKLRHGETGMWFVNSTIFSNWKESGPSSLLWIQGKPGAGKSVICSTIIKDIRGICNAGRASLAMYYYDFREDKKDLRGLLSSFLFQLCNQSDSYYNILSAFHLTHDNGGQRPSDDELVGCLRDLLKISPPVFLIIDGLDECPSTSSLSSPREELLSLLEDLIEARFTNLRICVTSQPEADIKAILDPLTFRSVSLHDEHGQKEDIKKYIESIINTNNNMRDWSSKHKKLVIDTLTEKANGMFQYVCYQLDHLAHCLPRDIIDALNALPDTLDRTYERTLRAINNTRWETARRLLQCISVSSRPLRVNELADVLALDFKAGPIPKYCKDLCLDDPVDAVLSTCSSLLVKVTAKDSRVIQFSHFSVKEFLISTRFAEKYGIISSRYHISMISAHTLLTKACLGILLHLDKNVTRDSLIKFPLAEYAAEHWLEHARFEGVSQNAEKGMRQLFDRTKHHLAVWLWICDPTVHPRYRNKSAKLPSPPLGTPLHYAAFCDLHEVVKVLAIEHPLDVNSRSFNNKSTPLHLVSQEGHVKLARLLLEHGADVTTQDQRGSTPLHRASKRGHVELAQLLLEYGADPATRDQQGSMPLHCASERSDVELARLLLKHGADAAARDQRGSTPLHCASERDHLGLTRLLLEHGADAAAQDQQGWTPLHWASGRGNIELVQLLLEHGADGAAQDQRGWTPLHWASKRGDVELAQFLLEHGADAATQDQGGSTPLHCASEKDHVELARSLLEHGADAAAQDQGGLTLLHCHGGWTPLHWASLRGHVELGQLLLEHGADTAAKDQRGWTPLHWASLRGDAEFAHLLLEHGANAIAQDQRGWKPLHCASLMDHVKLASLLLEHGADAAAQDQGGSTPLHCASLKSHVELARLLLEHGADAAAQDQGGSTPLHCVSERGDVELARLLLEHGANAAAQDQGGSTPLHCASERGDVKLARLLLNQGADAATQDQQRWTPLHWASKRGNVKLARLLLEHDANTAAPDQQGWTPLHWASERGHVELAQLLLEHGANAATQDQQGSTPLHWASERGDVEFTRLLLKHDADATAKDQRGWTPLYWASKRGNVELARLLLEQGANVATQDQRGWTPLHWASEKNHVELAQLLLEHDADVTAQSQRGSTPLHWASERGHVELARLLLEHGADAAAQDQRRWTPLHEVSKRGNVELARLLLEHGANTATADQEGQTPVHEASESGNMELIQLLLEYGASPVEPRM